jgi:hypothetical protein
LDTKISKTRGIETQIAKASETVRKSFRVN